MKKRIAVYGFVLALAILLAIGLQNFVRDVIVIPLLFIIWFAKLLLKSISQSNLWAIFLLFPVVFFLKNLKRLSIPPKTMDKTPEDVSGTVTIWVERFRNTKKGIHYERSLKQQLGRLSASILAYKTGNSPEQIKRSMESGSLEAPSAIQAFVKSSEGDIPQAHFGFELLSFFRSWTRKRGSSPLKKDAENVVKFLEDILEVKHER